MMDGFEVEDVAEPAELLSYDETVTYEEQVAALAVDSSRSAGEGSLVERISKNKVYVPPQGIFGGKVRESG